MSREEVCHNIKFYIEKLNTGENHAVVYDIDDTLICSQTLKPIEPVLESLHHAKKFGYKIILITAREGRPEVVSHTIDELSKHDIPFNSIYFRDADELNIPEYKRKTRLNLKSAGHDIKITVGDKWWDIGDDDEPDVGFIIPEIDMFLHARLGW